MRHFAVVGSGSRGSYSAEALEKAFWGQARIDILDRYPVPYGLIRFGVAPDHQSLKAVSKRYDKVADSAGVDFIGNVDVGRDISVEELLDLYDAVVLATGAPPIDRKLGVPGENLPGVIGPHSSSAGTTGTPSSRISTRTLAEVSGRRRQRQCRARLRRILSKTRNEFQGSDIVESRTRGAGRSAIRTITILGAADRTRSQ